MAMERNRSNISEIPRVCTIYRWASLLVSTLIYLFVSLNDITPLRGAIAAGMIAASGIGTHLYGKITSSHMNHANSWILASECVEITANGVLLYLSGGFSSPYLWYLISSIVMIMATEYSDKRCGFVLFPAVFWYLICARFGSQRMNFPPSASGPFRINTAIGFLMVICGFYMLFLSIRKLNRAKKDLECLNDSLRQETARSGQALRHTMELYDTFQLFGISEPQKVMDEMAELLCRVLSLECCMLLKTSLPFQTEHSGSCNLSEAEGKQILEYMGKRNPASLPEQSKNQIEIDGISYTLTGIRNQSGIAGGLIYRKEKNPPEDDIDQKGAFYLQLAGIIFQNMDLQAIAGESIIGEEQNRIASEIHDTVIQKLFAIACNVRLLSEQNPMPPPEKSKYQLRQVEKSLKSTMRELREAIYSTHWDSGGKESFSEKLTKYLDEIQALSGVRIQVEMGADPQRLTVTQKTTMYRIVCEAVNNAIRHGKASRIRVTMHLSEEQCIVGISDNGSGFKPGSQHYGQGLKNMYRMTSCLKGQLKINSGVGNGTVIQCRLPIDSSTGQSNQTKEETRFDLNTGRSSTRTAGAPFLNAGV